MSEFKGQIEQGVYPLSLPSSMAIDTAIRTIQKPPDGRTESALKHLYINVGTLIRNWIGMIPSGDEVDSWKLVDNILAEMEVIRSLLQGSSTVLTFYSSDASLYYKNMALQPQLRKWTDLDKSYLRATIMIQRKLLANQSTMVIHNYPYRLPGVDTPRVVMSHSSLDYLSRSSMVLESHTGVLRTSTTKYTKYRVTTKDKMPVNLERMPFSIHLLLILGTKDLFKSQPPKIKDSVIELATQRRWSPLTSDNQIRSDLNLHPKHGSFFRALTPIK